MRIGLRVAAVLGLPLIIGLAAVVEIPELNLTEMNIRLERRDGRGNYESIVTHYLREGRHVGDPDRLYVIHELVVEDAVVHLDLLPEAGETARLLVPIELRLTGVGEAEAGLMLQGVVGVAGLEWPRRS